MSERRCGMDTRFETCKTYLRRAHKEYAKEYVKRERLKIIRRSLIFFLPLNLLFVLIFKNIIISTSVVFTITFLLTISSLFRVESEYNNFSNYVGNREFKDGERDGKIQLKLVTLAIVFNAI